MGAQPCTSQKGDNFWVAETDMPFCKRMFKYNETEKESSYKREHHPSMKWAKIWVWVWRCEAAQNPQWGELWVQSCTLTKCFASFSKIN